MLKHRYKEHDTIANAKLRVSGKCILHFLCITKDMGAPSEKLFSIDEILSDSLVKDRHWRLQEKFRDDDYGEVRFDYYFKDEAYD